MSGLLYSTIMPLFISSKFATSQPHSSLTSKGFSGSMSSKKSKFDHGDSIKVAGFQQKKVMGTGIGHPLARQKKIGLVEPKFIQGSCYKELLMPRRCFKNILS